MRTFVLDTEYKAVTGQQTRFFVLDEAVAEAAHFARKMNRSLKIWEYENQVRTLAGSVQPDGTLVKPSKEVAAVVEALCASGNSDLANKILNS